MITQLNKVYNRQTSSLPFVEAFTVPGATGPSGAYVKRLAHVPSASRSPKIAFTGTSSSGSAYTLSLGIPSAAGQVFLDVITGDLFFHSTDTGRSVSVAYDVYHSLQQADDINQLIVWSQIKPAFIAGIPTVVEYGDVGPSTPQAVITIPGGIAAGVTVKHIEIFSANIAGVAPTSTLTMVVSVSSNPISTITNFTEGVHYATVQLTSYIGEDGVEQGCWFCSKAVNWFLNTSSDVLLYLFPHPTSSGDLRHSDVTITLKGV